MLVDGPSYQEELVQRPVNQVTERTGKPQTAQITPQRAVCLRCVQVREVV
jgi:hypothetical protein